MIQRILVLWLFVGILLCNAAVNLVRNGDFEHINSAGYCSHFSHLPEWGGNKLSASSFLPSGNAYSGRFAARYDSVGHGGFISSGAMVLKPGKTYRFSAMIKTDLPPVMLASVKSDPPPGAYIQLMPVLPKSWTGAWPRIGLPRLYAGGGKQDWRKYSGYFIADQQFNSVWMGIYIMHTEGTAWFDDLELVELSPEEIQSIPEAQPDVLAKQTSMQYVNSMDSARPTHSPQDNLMVNGSFEQTANGDFPDYVWSVLGAAWFEDSWETRLIHASTAPHGDYYFHLVGKFLMISSKIGFTPGSTYSVSFYAKSARQGQRCHVSFANVNHTIQLTESWSLHHLVFANVKGQSKTTRLSIGCSGSKGEMDLDAVMLHEGTMRLPYTPSPAELSLNKSLAVRHTPFFADNAKQMKLQDCPEFILPGTPSTRITLSERQGTMRLHVECHEPDMKKTLTYPQNIPWMMPFGDAISISFMPSPSHGNLAYKTFIVDAEGKKFASRALGQKLDVSWDVSIKRGQDKWIADIRIPLAVLSDNLPASGLWGFNLVRNRPATQGRQALVTGWNGPRIHAYGKLDMGHHAPVVSLGKLDYVYDAHRNVILTVPADAPQGTTWSIRLEPGANTLFGRLSDGRVRFSPMSKLTLFGSKTALLECKQGDSLLFSTLLRLPSKWPALSIKQQYDTVFSGEGNRYRIDLALSPEDCRQATLAMEFKNSQGDIKQELFPHPHGDLVAGKGLPDGVYSVCATLICHGRRTAVPLPWTFRIVPPASRYTRVDYFSRMTEKDGKPFFPCALGFSLSWRYRDKIAEIKETGFNTVYIWSSELKDPFNVRQLEEVYDLLEQHKLSAIQHLPLTLDNAFIKKHGWFGHIGHLPVDTIIANKRDMMSKLTGKPALRIWGQFDEIYNDWCKPPVRKKESMLSDCYRAFHETEPYRIQWNNSVIGSHLFGGAESADIASSTIYTIRNNGGAAETISAGDVLAQVGEKLGGKPGIAGIWLQFYGGSGEISSGGREPSADEMTAMMYGCAIKGVRAFSYFNQRANSNHLYEVTGQRIRELEQLTPVLAYGHYVPVNSSHSAVLALGVEYEQALYLITVNSSYVGSHASFLLPPGYGSGVAEDYFVSAKHGGKPSRSHSPDRITYTDHTLAIPYQALERKVFVIKKE